MQERPSQIDARSASVVSPVADDGMAYGAQVHPNLVGPSRLEPTRQQRCPPGFAETLEDLIVGQRAAPASGHRHPRRMPWRSPDRSIDRPLIVVEETPDQRLVDPFGFVSRHLSNELEVGLGAAGNNEQTRRRAIESMHDPGPVRFTDRGHLRVAGQKAVDQSPLEVSRTGMDDEVDRFVHDNNVGVLIYDSELHLRISSRLRIPGSGSHCFDRVARKDTDRSGSRSHSVYRHSPLINHPSGYGATHLSHQGNDSVKALIGQSCGDLF